MKKSMEPIQTKGTESLSEQERQFANDMINKYFVKMQRQLNNDVTLEVNFKVYQSAGKKKGDNKARKYSLNASLKSSTNNFKASYADWDFNRTIHRVLKKLEEEIEHRFHVSEQGKE